MIDGRDDLSIQLRASLTERKNIIDSLFRPSVRRVISFTDTIRDRAPIAGFESAWQYALEKAIEDETNEAVGSLSVVSGAPLDVVRDWQGRAEQHSSGKYAGAGFQMPRGASLTPRMNNFLRICVRDGILVPRGTAPPKFDQPHSRYEVNPLICAPPSAYRGMTAFARNPRAFPITVDDLDHWSARRRAPSSERQDRSSISVVGARAVEIADRLTSAVEAAATVEVVTPDDTDVEATVSKSDLLVADLMELSPLLTFAVGTAIARGIPVRTVATASSPSPKWLPKASADLLDDTEAISALTFEVYEFCDSLPPPRIAGTPMALVARSVTALSQMCLA